MCILHVFGVQVTVDIQRSLSVKPQTKKTSTVSRVQVSMGNILCILTLARGFQVKHMK